MRTYEEILEVIQKPYKLMDCDIYGVSIIELYPFVEIKDIPKAIVDRMDKEVVKSWNPEEERLNFSLEEDLGEELEFIEKLLDNDEDLPAVSRFPRALSIIWVSGKSIENYVKEYKKVLSGKVERSRARRMMRKLVKSIRDDIIPGVIY